MRKMKKTLAAMMAATMVLSMNMTAWAEVNPNTNMTSINFTKKYIETNENTTSPEETFTFTISAGAAIGENGAMVYVKDAATGIANNDTIPVPTIGNVHFGQGGATVAGATGSVNISFLQTGSATESIYSGVGVYYYTIRETDGGTAGVGYRSEPIILVVTVQQTANGRITVAGVHAENPPTFVNQDGTQGTNKADVIENTYSAGKLSVHKTVSGNAGDQTKDFIVTATFTKPEGDTVKEAIICNADFKFVGTDGTTSEPTTPKTIAASEWGEAETLKVQFTVKHDTTVNFTNIPYGVTYTVTENDYKNDGYETTTVNYDVKNDEENVDLKVDEVEYAKDNNTSLEVDTEFERVEITNNKGVPVDTGVVLDSMPYIILLAVAACGVFFVARKKRDEEMF